MATFLKDTGFSQLLIALAPTQHVTFPKTLDKRHFALASDRLGVMHQDKAIHMLPDHHLLFLLLPWLSVRRTAFGRKRVNVNATCVHPGSLRCKVLQLSFYRQRILPLTPLVCPI